MIVDSPKMKGTVKIQKFNELGECVETNISNLVVDSGRALMAARLAGNTQDAPGYVAVGTGDTAEVVGDTALENEIARVATSGTTQITVNVTNDSVQYVASFGQGVGTGALTEAGLFNAEVGGAMLSRTTFPVMTKQASDSIVITWVITFL